MDNINEENKIINQKFNRWTVLEIIDSKKIKCQCECGKIKILWKTNVISGKSKSCGCLAKEISRKKRILNKYNLMGEYGIGYVTKGAEFYFDLEDYEKIKSYTWQKNQEGYVYSFNDNKVTKMHRLIMCAPKGKVVDHINHKPYDNRKENLRICEHYKNIISSKTYSNNTSGRKGVYWDKSRNKWMVCITANNKTFHLGRFKEFDDAVKVREEAEKKYHKEFCYDNVVKI